MVFTSGFATVDQASGVSGAERVLQAYEFAVIIKDKINNTVIKVHNTRIKTGIPDQLSWATSEPSLFYFLLNGFTQKSVLTNASSGYSS